MLRRHFVDVERRRLIDPQKPADGAERSLRIATVVVTII
jgi:hypothetical protein